MSEADARPPFVDALMDPAAWPWPVCGVERVETHISWVFLAGDYACKFKKPLDLGFLDFRDPARRAHFCAEELRLNRRLAPQLYLGRVTARHTAGGWRVSDDSSPAAGGPEAEPGVKMRRFPAEDQADRRLAAGKLGGDVLERFGVALARFQRELPPARPGQGHGDAAAVLRPARANLTSLRDGDGRLRGDLEALRFWTENRAAALAPRFDARLAAGFVREGHGDLHLGNLVMLGPELAAFDGIEFDPGLRWIDLQSEVAFLLMDLESRDRGALGWRFYNAWLAELGDYDGLDLLPWYLVYRHLVRAKIDGIRLAQPGLSADETERLAARQARHVALATAHAAPRAPLLVLMHGYSGSGKSRLAGRLAPLLPAVWVRSDLERKRLHGLDPAAPAGAPVGAGLYDAAATERTYARLDAIAHTGLGAGLNVLLDATFLEAARRQHFIDLATRLGAVPVVLACEAPAAILRERVAGRRGGPSDAGLAVLEAQLARPAQAAPSEAAYRVRIDTQRRTDLPALAAALRRRTEARKPGA